MVLTPMISMPHTCWLFVTSFCVRHVRERLIRRMCYGLNIFIFCIIHENIIGAPKESNINMFLFKENIN